MGLRYKQLLNFCEPCFGKENAFVVVLGDFVNTDDGTGIVHMAPTFGADDKRVAEENNIPPMLVFDKENRILRTLDVFFDLFLCELLFDSGSL